MRFRPALIFVAGVLGALGARAEDAAAYARVTHERAAKIVATLGLGDAAKTERVTAMVAQQYRDLRAIHDPRDTRIKAAQGRDGAAAEESAARAEAEAKLAILHREFLGRLATELSAEQLEAVKDGLTYGVMPLTFRVYQDMLPNLTAGQREQIRAWLLEAREKAMDEGSADAKHAVFGKYKGRINNFLARAGIDLKQAEKDAAARRRAASAPGTK
jgi:hypothetical protein